MKRAKKQKLSNELDRIFERMESIDPSSDEYEKLLLRAKAILGQLDRGRSPEVTAGVFSLLGIGTIAVLERSGPLLSKALGFVRKPR